MANYLAVNPTRTQVRFFRDVCDIIVDGHERTAKGVVARKKEKRTPFLLEQKHVMVEPYRMYGKTRTALALGNVVSYTAAEAIAYLRSVDADDEQIQTELDAEDYETTKTVIKETVEAPQEDITPTEVEHVKVTPTKTAAPRKRRRKKGE